jgi:hypothetical protein
MENQSFLPLCMNVQVGSEVDLSSVRGWDGNVEIRHRRIFSLNSILMEKAWLPVGLAKCATEHLRRSQDLSPIALCSRERGCNCGFVVESKVSYVPIGHPRYSDRICRT